MEIFSFRAECMADIESFEKACVAANVIVELTTVPDTTFPDVDVEMKSTTSLNQLRDVMRSVDDGHVMVQTLRQCALKDNSLERDYDLI